MILGVFAALALATHPQVLKGKVPFAADTAIGFPPWDGIPMAQATPHAEVGDSVTLFYPWRVFQAFALQRGQLPLWNPRILGGTPFLANAQSALFYPFHLLLFFQSPATFWTVRLLVNLMLAGFFTALFVRTIGGSRTGAIAAGVIFSCCGFMAAWQAFSSLADGAIWLPFIFWAVYRLCWQPTAKMMVITAIALAMPVLAGHPETAAHLTLMGWGFALWQCVANGRRDGTVVRRLLWVTSAELLAIGISAVQIIPTLEWLGHIQHSLSIRWPTRPVRELRAFLSRDILQNPNSAGLPIPESAAYVAPLALLLAPMAFYHRRREFFFFLTAIVISLGVVGGWFPIQQIVEHIPVVAGMKNWRVLLFIDFSLAVLAGLGATALCEALPRRTSFRRYVWSALCITALGSGLVIYKLARLTRVPVDWIHGPQSTAVFLLIGFMLIAARILNLASRRAFALLVLSLLLIDMVSFRVGVLPFFSRSEIFPNAPVFDYLKAHADPSVSRVSSISATYTPNVEMIYGLAALDGYELVLARTRNLLQDFSADSTGIALTAEQIVKIADRRLDLMNLRYLVATSWNNSEELLASRPDRFKLVFSDGSVRIFENLRAFSRATFIASRPNSVEVIPDDFTQLARVKNPAFDPERSVILPATAEELQNPTQTESNPKGPDTVSTLNYGINASNYEVVNHETGILLISQMYYPGWLAIVDGKEVSPLRADYALIAVPLKEGQHRVQLVFRPGSFTLGLAISLVSCLVLLALVAFTARKR